MSDSTSTTSGQDSWEPVLNLDTDVVVGLVNDADVYVGDANGPRRPVDTGSPTFLLPLMEHSYDTVVARLCERELELGKGGGYYIEKIPLRRMPFAAVAMQSGYWADHALKWIAAMPSPAEFRPLLAEVQAAGWASQRLRHEARRLLRRLGE